MHADETLARLIATLGPAAETIALDPAATLEPSLGGDTHARRVLEALAPSAGPAPLLLGATLGEGGMGVVRLATQPALGRQVAVKSLRADHRHHGATLKLLQEAWITGALEHPNIVPVYELGADPDGSPRLVLRRIEGRPWSELLREPALVRASFGADDALEWHLRVLLQVASAVSFAHARGIVHRDIKPANVMVGAYGEVYLLDWGIAAALADDGTGRLPVARFGPMVGTPCYMAPEMLDGRADERTDVYLLGATLFEILSGRPPHAGRDVEALLRSILGARPAPPDTVPAELARICRRALDPEPGARQASADELHRALQDFLQHRGSLRIAEEAERALHELRGLPLDAPERHDRFGACRFGFREALRAWPGNETARRGLEEAVTLRIDEALAAGDVGAARLLLADLDAPPDALAARVAEAERRLADRDRALAAAARENDPRVGARERLFLGAVLALFWTVAPAVLAVTVDLSEATATHERHLLSSGVFLALVAGTGVAWRRALFSTALNRRLYLTVLTAPVAQVALDLGLWLARGPVVLGHVMHLLLWFVASTILAISGEPWLAVPALGYLVAFFVVAGAPGLLYFAIAASNAVLLAAVLWRWAPR